MYNYIYIYYNPQALLVQDLSVHLRTAPYRMETLQTIQRERV